MTALADVKALRMRTDAGWADCKAALDACAGDMEQAIDWLRAKGIDAAAKRANKPVSEGVVAVAQQATTIAMIEIGSETDFVARNPDFRNAVRLVARTAAERGVGTSDALLNERLADNQTVGAYLDVLSGRVGERLSLQRIAVIRASDPAEIAVYMHGGLGTDVGQIGVVVLLKGDDADLQAFGRKIGMQIAAMRPDVVEASQVPSQRIAREEGIIREQIGGGKPEAVVTRIVQGKLAKFMASAVLLEQSWVHDSQMTVGEACQRAGVTVSAFLRFQVGEAACIGSLARFASPG